MSQISVTPSPDEINYQLQHFDDNEGPAIIIATTIFYSSALVAVVLRFISRFTLSRRLQLDDYLIMIGLV
jgi:hypothetical protein